jgi:hypothetical protein
MDAMVKVGPCWPLVRGWERVTNFKRRTSERGEVLFNVPPSIAMAECVNASAGGEKDHRIGFRMVDIMTRKILTKN